MKGIKMTEMHRDREEDSIIAEAGRWGWDQATIDREVALIETRFDVNFRHVDDLFLLTTLFDRFEAYEDNCYMVAFAEGACAFRAVFGEVA